VIISKRHKKTGLRTKVVRKITEIPAHDWKKVFPDVLENYEFFATLDKSGIEQFAFYYILVYERDKPVAATACFLMNYSLDTSINGPLRRISNLIKRVMPGIFSIRAFVCGMPMGRGHIGMAGEKGRIMHAILRRMEQIAKKKRAPIIAFKDFEESYTSLLDPLERSGFRKFDSLPTTELNVWFKDFEEYLKTLSSPNRYDQEEIKKGRRPREDRFRGHGCP